MERRVDAFLNSRGIHSYLPLIPLRRHRRGSAQRVIEPLFPRYLFTRLDLEEIGVSVVAFTPGLRDFVRMDGQPVVVADAIVSEIQSQLASGAAEQRQLQPRFHSGDPVRVKDGPLAGLNALFERQLPGRLRARILVQLLGGQRPIELDESLLERASR
jgi:transcriptional antiterminator RfaH